MRDFSKTAEPSGATGPPDPGPGNRFVVQRHRARALHYDLRLEMGGVLASWAVPKGPTLDPKARRLAVHVEDHPLDYFDFEGVIPSGEYGGGDVIVWDWGTWSSGKEGEDDPVQAVEDGEIHFDLDGEKLARPLRARPHRQGRRQAVDAAAQEGRPRGRRAGTRATTCASVKSGLTNDEVKAAPPDTWTRDEHRWDPPTDAELAALDELAKQGEWDFQGRTLKLTNLDKVLFPGRDGEEPLTKRDLVRYHARVAPWMLPYLEGRPLNTNRFPDGVDKKGFWSKAHPSHAPDWLTQLALRRPREGRDRVVHGGRQPAGAPVAGQLRSPRAPPVDLEGRRAPRAHVGVHRHRSRPEEPVGRRGPARRSLPRRARPPRGARLARR